jgi:hypothetical protein
MLDAVGVPTPRRLVTFNHDFPELSSIVKIKFKELGINPKKWSQAAAKMIDNDTIQVGDQILKKPFVEKPVSGENHNIYIYYDSANGGGVRKLFRKKGNKSSEFDPNSVEIRTDGSYIYEEFMVVDNSEDVKVYTIGTDFSYAETRKSPVVDGVVRRNSEGKEIRYVTTLNDEEQLIAKKVCKLFGQTVCGFDLLRAGGKSFVIDVNGWSFVKGSNSYYDQFSSIVSDKFLKEAKRGPRVPRSLTISETPWKLKAFLSVMRHADRTPKQKIKFTFVDEIFLNLVREERNEVVYKKWEQFEHVAVAVRKACEVGIGNVDNLNQILHILEVKGNLPGTKVQLRPIFQKKTSKLIKMQIIIKWGGLFTHGGLHHSIDLAANLRTDLNIIDKDLLQDIHVLSSSEKRVTDTAEVFCKTLLKLDDLPQSLIQISKEKLDDSNEAKEQTDIVKAKLQAVLNPDVARTPPVEFIMPPDWVDLSKPVRELIELMRKMRIIMNENLNTMPEFEVNWCCYETPILFKERWEKLFRDICDVDGNTFEPSKVSELYDALKFDLIHNREYLYFVFQTESANLTAELCSRSKALFDIIGPHEYGIEDQEKLEIGFKNIRYLITDLFEQLQAAQQISKPFTRLYFTKESKVYSLLNVVLLCGLKTNFKPTDISELDYLTQITFELYERGPGLANSHAEFSLRIGFSPGTIHFKAGAHDPNLIELDLNPEHSLSVTPRRWLTDYLSLDDSLKLLTRNEILHCPTKDQI